MRSKINRVAAKSTDRSPVITEARESCQSWHRIVLTNNKNIQKNKKKIPQPAGQKARKNKRPNCIGWKWIFHMRQPLGRIPFPWHQVRIMHKHNPTGRPKKEQKRKKVSKVESTLQTTTATLGGHNACKLAIIFPGRNRFRSHFIFSLCKFPNQ